MILSFSFIKSSTVSRMLVKLLTLLQTNHYNLPSILFVLVNYITPSKIHFCEEYTYFRSGSVNHGDWIFWRYSCSCYDTKNCKAHIYIYKDDVIIADTQHNHLPLEYIKTKKGLFLQV